MCTCNSFDDEHNARLTYLMGLPDSAYVNRKDVAILIGCCEDHITRLVKRGEFPPPYPFGKLLRWKLGDIRRFGDDRAAAALVPS